MQTAIDTRVPTVSPAARRLLSLVPERGEPPSMALKEIAAGIGALSDYELNAVLVSIGRAVRAARHARQCQRGSQPAPCGPD